MIFILASDLSPTITQLQKKSKAEIVQRENTYVKVDVHRVVKPCPDRILHLTLPINNQSFELNLTACGSLPIKLVTVDQVHIISFNHTAAMN